MSTDGIKSDILGMLRSRALVTVNELPYTYVWRFSADVIRRAAKVGCGKETCNMFTGALTIMELLDWGR
jgi:hypothetical protein